MPEQAIVLKAKYGLVVITGCAHHGILEIIEKIKAKFPGYSIYLVLGGFHLMESDKRIIETIVKNFKKMGIKKVGPAHCTGKTATELFKKEYKDNFVEVKAGKILEV